MSNRPKHNQGWHPDLSHSKSTKTGPGHQITQSARSPRTDLWPSCLEWQLVVCKPIVMINRPLISNSNTAATTTTHTPLKCNHPSGLGPHIRNCWVDVSRAGCMRFPMELGQRWVEHNRVSCFHKCNSWDPRGGDRRRCGGGWEGEQGDKRGLRNGGEIRGKWRQKVDKKREGIVGLYCTHDVILGLWESSVLQKKKAKMF